MTVANTLSMAILSGKGGVGKSNVALNLAHALNRHDGRVLLVDCDLGLASLDVLMGVQTGDTLEQLLHSEREAADIAIPLQREDGGEGPFFIPAASGDYNLGRSAAALSSLFLEKLSPFATDFDYLIMDVGAGISAPVQIFASMAVLRVVVVTPEPTSLTDAYALMKVLSSAHGIRDFFILVNQADSKQEEELAFSRISSACDRFLGFKPLMLGAITLDKALPEAVIRQKALLDYAPASRAAEDFRTMATRLARLRATMQPRLVPGEPLRPPVSISL
ncbi:P-loop NTPase [Desulfovibrio sp. OttesenSCG-928-I05]|nr:P-loop NTPase [Desulfovibrio sp. OttesenSCG-928-I05]